MSRSSCGWQRRRSSAWRNGAAARPTSVAARASAFRDTRPARSAKSTPAHGGGASRPARRRARAREGARPAVQEQEATRPHEHVVSAPLGAAPHHVLGGPVRAHVGIAADAPRPRHDASAACPGGGTWIASGGTTRGSRRHEVRSRSSSATRRTSGTGSGGTAPFRRRAPPALAVAGTGRPTPSNSCGARRGPVRRCAVAEPT